MSTMYLFFDPKDRIFLSVLPLSLVSEDVLIMSGHPDILDQPTTTSEESPPTSGTKEADSAQNFSHNFKRCVSSPLFLGP